MMIKSRGFERLGERKIHRLGQGGERIARHGAQSVLDAMQVFDQIFAAAKIEIDGGENRFDPRPRGGIDNQPFGLGFGGEAAQRLGFGHQGGS